mmetsp:Transcript_69246/g.102981  ORF Transcript_69246/g.102981 Transcript_69246/m.102981 type:complete len:137 (+) Transcript_69246:2199-2609(+)
MQQHLLCAWLHKDGHYFMSLSIAFSCVTYYFSTIFSVRLEKCFGRCDRLLNPPPLFLRALISVLMKDSVFYNLCMGQMEREPLNSDAATSFVRVASQRWTLFYVSFDCFFMCHLLFFYYFLTFQFSLCLLSNSISS